MDGIKMMHSKAEVQATEEPKTDHRLSALDLGADAANDEALDSEFYKSSGYRNKKERTEYLRALHAYLDYEAIVHQTRLEEIENAFAAVEEAALHIEDEIDEEIIEWIDPIPGWEPLDNGEPLWIQCLHDDVQWLVIEEQLQVPHFQAMTLDEYAHYCARKAIVQFVRPKTLPEDKRDCPICMDPLHDYKAGTWEEMDFAAQVSCRGQHIIGSNCLLKWVEELVGSDNVYGCPLCRDKLVDPPNEEPQYCLADFIHSAQHLVLPARQLKRYEEIYPWLPIFFMQLRLEVRFVCYFLRERIDFHIPSRKVAIWRERAKLLMIILLSNLPKYLRDKFRAPFYQPESEESVQRETRTARQSLNTYLLHSLQEIVMWYVKEMGDSVNDFWTKSTPKEVRNGELDGWSRESWIREISVHLYYSNQLNNISSIPQPDDEPIRTELKRREELLRIGVFRFLFAHSKSYSATSKQAEVVPLEVFQDLLGASSLPRLNRILIPSQDDQSIRQQKEKCVKGQHWRNNLLDRRGGPALPPPAFPPVDRNPRMNASEVLRLDVEPEGDGN